MLNRVVLVGRMTRDPELRRTNTGTAVTSFTIAMNRNFTNQNRERQADFIPCIVWNKTAENVAKYCAKGSLVGIDGRLQSRQYENQDGRRVTIVEVVCDSVQFLDTRSQDSNRQVQQSTQPQNNFNDAFYDMNGTDIKKEIDSLIDTYDIFKDDIQI